MRAVWRTDAQYEATRVGWSGKSALDRSTRARWLFDGCPRRIGCYSVWENPLRFRADLFDRLQSAI